MENNIVYTTIFLILILILILISAIIFLASFIFAALSAAPWLPTNRRQRRRLIELISLKPGQIVYDLGCGDGAVIFSLANKYPEAKFAGFEVSLFPYLIAIFRKFLRYNKYKNVSIKYKDFFKQDIREADLIFIFLTTKCYPRLINKLSKEIKENCLVVVEAWPLPDLKPIKYIKEKGFTSLYFYQGSQFIR